MKFALGRLPVALVFSVLAVACIGPIQAGTRSRSRSRMPVFKEGPAAIYEGSYTVPEEAIQTGESYHRLLVYRPNPMVSTKSYPVVIVIHGGGFVAGDKEEKDSFSRKVSDQGFVVVNIDYRLAPPPGLDYRKRGSFPYPAAINDAKAVVAWIKDSANVRTLKKNYGLSLDTHRIGVIGFSAGGTMAAQLALSKLVQASVVCSGVSDFVEDSLHPRPYATWIHNWFRDPQNRPQAAWQLQKKLWDASPARDLKRMVGAPPILVVHGLKDPKVLPSQARLLLHNLRLMNPKARHKYLNFFYNGNHNNLGGYRRIGFTYRAMFEFLKTNLRQPAKR